MFILLTSAYNNYQHMYNMSTATSNIKYILIFPAYSSNKPPQSKSAKLSMSSDISRSSHELRYQPKSHTISDISQSSTQSQISAKVAHNLRYQPKYYTSSDISQSSTQSQISPKVAHNLRYQPK
ncbi:hypothetical protein BsWGS_00932 [Bradybaena similaris]